MADTKKKAILLRVSPELWAGLQRWAANDLRSVNAQIEYVLREALRRWTRQPAGDDGTSESRPDTNSTAPRDAPRAPGAESGSGSTTED